MKLSINLESIDKYTVFPLGNCTYIYKLNYNSHCVVVVQKAKKLHSNNRLVWAYWYLKSIFGICMVKTFSIDTILHDFDVRICYPKLSYRLAHILICIPTVKWCSIIWMSRSNYFMESYCNTPGVSVGVNMLKLLVQIM